MIEFANDIKTQMFNALAYQKVSLMIGGCQRLGKNYVMIVIFAPERLYLYSVLDISNEKSITLANLISRVVNDLKNQTLKNL